MSPVHVLISEDQRQEQEWASAFAGAVDCYRFPTNVDALERLTVAQAPIDLLIITTHQTNIFNMTPDQLLARIFESPLAKSQCLSNMHVLVVGAQVRTPRPQVACVTNIEAGIRLVKFGEIEQTPMPVAPTAAAAPARHASARSTSPDSQLVGSIISSIWDEPEVNPRRNPSRDVRGGGAPARARRRAAAAPAAAPPAPRQMQRPPSAPQLFAGIPRPTISQAAPPVRGGGPEVEAERIIVGSGPVHVPGPLPGMQPQGQHEAVLQPVLPAILPNGAGYRGPGMRAGHMLGGASHAGAQHVPPALTAQVQHLVHQPAAQIADPVLGFSRGPGQTDDIATTPMQPPVAHAQAPMPTDSRPVPSADPFMRRAEGGAGASFG